MAAPAFHHGITYTELKSRLRVIQQVRTGVGGMIVTAPIHKLPKNQRTLNKNIVLLSDADRAYYFGAEKDGVGYTAHTSVNAFWSQGGGAIIAVNVFDPERHRTLGAPVATSGNHSVTSNIATVTTENPHGLVVGDFVNITGFTGALAPLNQSYAEVLTAPTGATFTFALENANIAATASTAGVVKKITFDPSLVTSADIIGTVDAEGNRTGMKVWQDARTTIGDVPRLLCIPTYSTQEEVAVAMEVIANKIGAGFILDAPAGLTTQQIFEGRGVTGTINLNTSSTRAYLVDMHVYAYNAATEREELMPASPFVAGLISRVDREEGFWVSPSNHELRGITGVERPVYFDVMDPDAEATQLNARGVATIVRNYGTGFILWGNRSAAYPSNADPESFFCIRRVMDVLKYSLGYNMQPFVDLPMTRGSIESVLASMNAFVDSLVGQGALVGGKVAFEPDENDPINLAQGKIKFNLKHMAPTPMEHIIIDSQMDIELFRALFETI